jgi:hypothetical protein
MRNVFIKNDDQEITGPFDEETIKSMIKHGAVKPYWHVGDEINGWELVDKIYEKEVIKQSPSKSSSSTGLGLTSLISSSIGLLLLIGAGDVRGDSSILGLSIVLIILGAVGAFFGIFSIMQPGGKKFGIPGLILGLLLCLFGYAATHAN